MKLKLRLQDQVLTQEDEMIVEKYVRNVIVKLKRLYNVDEKEALQLLEGSAFLETLSTDPEYVLNHNTGYWVEELITRKISQRQYV